jgi:hypothetical protein
MPTFGPIESEPRRVRPPYDQPDTAPPVPAWGGGEVFERWRAQRHADRAAALLEPLAGLEVSEFERHIVSWLAGWETGTVAVVAALLHRARAAAPLPSSGHHPKRGVR